MEAPTTIESQTTSPIETFDVQTVDGGRLSIITNVENWRNAKQAKIASGGFNEKEIDQALSETEFQLAVANKIKDDMETGKIDPTFLLNMTAGLNAEVNKKVGGMTSEVLSQVLASDIPSVSRIESAFEKQKLIDLSVQEIAGILRVSQTVLTSNEAQATPFDGYDKEKVIGNIDKVKADLDDFNHLLRGQQGQGLDFGDQYQSASEKASAPTKKAEPHG